MAADYHISRGKSMLMLLEAFCRSPSFKRLIEDGCRAAAKDRRFDDVTAYRAIGDQLANVPR
jgi:hypothetical protein